MALRSVHIAVNSMGSSTPVPSCRLLCLSFEEDAVTWSVWSYGLPDRKSATLRLLSSTTAAAPA